MRIVARPVIDTSPLETHRVSLRDWLVSLIAWLIEALADTWLHDCITEAQREFDADLRNTARELRMLLVAHAFARLNPHHLSPSANRAHRRTQNPTPGAFIRKCTAPVLKRLHRGSLSERAARLQHHLDNLEPLIDAVLAHMRAMFARPRIAGPQIRIATATPVSCKSAFAPPCANTS